MRFPWATLVLSLALVVPYFLASSGAFYLSDDAVYGSAFSVYNAGGWLTHIFAHVGAFHLAGNLLPLVMFGVLLESVLLPLDVIALFLSCGLFASAVFALLNPGSYLVGASAAIAGVMTAALAVRPRSAIVLVLVTPLLISAAAFPLVDSLVRGEQASFASESTEFAEQARLLAEENRTAEAFAANASAYAAAEKEALVAGGRVREESTPTDFLVHFYGAAFAAVYLALFKKRELAEGAAEFHGAHEALARLFRRAQ
ncbi:MAG: rhomboid family intramembrane serine protease [Candidatus Micrarchaeia archaeon]